MGGLLNSVNTRTEKTTTSFYMICNRRPFEVAVQGSNTNNIMMFSAFSSKSIS